MTDPKTRTAKRERVPMRFARVALWLFVMTVVVLAWTGVRMMTAIHAYQFDGPSMEPTFAHEDRVLVDQTAYGLSIPEFDGELLHWAQPERGDVVVANSPADGVDIIKRVIAIGGDTIEIRDGETILNGSPISHQLIGACEPGRQKDPSPDCRVYEDTIGEVTFRIAHDEGWSDRDHGVIEIPEDHVYIRGDHRDHSNDSTNPLIGAVPVRRLRGRVFATYWSAK